MTRALRNLLVVLAVAALAAACSVSRVAYLNATPIAMWYLDGYVDMSGGQKEWARERISRAIDWHRSEELPEYHRFLGDALAKLEGPVTVEDVREAHRQARGYYHRIVERLLPDAADLVLQLEGQQIEALEGRFDGDNRKILRDSLRGTPEERRAKVVKRYVGQFEDWTGRLSGVQRAIIARHVHTMPDVTEERVGDRRFRQGEALELMRARPPRERVIEGLRRLLIETDTWRRPEYIAMLRERDEHLFAIISELSATLTPQQRERLRRKAQGYMRDISEISASKEGVRVAGLLF